MSILWPSKTATYPSPMQHFARIVHWVCAIVAVYFIYRAFEYMIHNSGVPDWKALGAIILKVVLFWLGGRTFRFVFGAE